MSRDWRLYLEDMIDCCQKIIDYTSGLDMPVFKDTSLAYDTTLRNVEILGKAAKHTPKISGDATHRWSGERSAVCPMS